MITTRDIAEFQRATSPLFPPFASGARLSDIAITLTPVDDSNPVPSPTRAGAPAGLTSPSTPPAGVPLIRDEG